MIIQLTSIHDDSAVHLVAANVCAITTNSQGRTVVSDNGGSRYLVKELPADVASKLYWAMIDAGQGSK